MASVILNGQNVYVNTMETKEQFINHAQRLEKHYELLKAFYSKVFRPVIDLFHGKQANSRFLLELQSRALELDENIIIGHLNRYDDGAAFLHVSTTYAGNNISNGLQIAIEEETACDGTRVINCAATLRRNRPWRDSQKTMEDDLQTMADGCRDSIANYEKYLQQVAELSEKVNAYNKQVPFCFHYHIKAEFLRAY